MFADDCKIQMASGGGWKFFGLDPRLLAPTRPSSTAPGSRRSSRSRSNVRPSLLWQPGLHLRATHYRTNPMGRRGGAHARYEVALDSRIEWIVFDLPLNG